MADNIVSFHLKAKSQSELTHKNISTNEVKLFMGLC